MSEQLLYSQRARLSPPAGQYERVSTAAARALLRVPGRALGFADVRLVRSALHWRFAAGEFRACGVGSVARSITLWRAWLLLLLYCLTNA